VGLGFRTWCLMFTGIYLFIYWFGFVTLTLEQVSNSGGLNMDICVLCMCRYCSFIDDQT
jgi:hypothetical protein